MLNVVRSSVITSTRRTHCVGNPAYLDSILYRQSSTDATHDDTSKQTDFPVDSSGTKTPKIDRSKVPTLNEAELDERFICGWGPGGQKVNKAINCCQLRHRPTGIIVKVQQSRSLEQNRKIARELLAQRLDDLYNGPDSVTNQAKRLALQRIASRESLSQRRRSMKDQFRRSFGANCDD